MMIYLSNMTIFQFATLNHCSLYFKHVGKTRVGDLELRGPFKPNPKLISTRLQRIPQ